MYFYRINMPSYGTGGYFAPLTDFNAVEAGGFAGRSVLLYLCSAIKGSGLSPPLHFSRNQLISKAFFRYCYIYIDKSPCPMPLFGSLFLALSVKVIVDDLRLRLPDNFRQLLLPRLTNALY